jgi:hypothetical protein
MYKNKVILQYCYSEAGMKVKQYLSNYKTKEEWENHFGMKWETFQERTCDKAQPFE